MGFSAAKNEPSLTGGTGLAGDTGGNSAGEAAVDAAEAASNSPVLDVVARAGFAVMALLHVVIGAIAVALVLGAPGQADATGAIEQLAANPWVRL